MASGERYRRERRRWLALGLRIVRLLWHQPARTTDLVRQSYDHVAEGYDQAWTNHMRDLSRAMIDKLAPPPGARCLDLMCGTGFLAAELASRGGRPVVGVDLSNGMLETARRHCGSPCVFLQADVLDYLRSQPRDSVDIITCGWGLGYTRPLAVVRQAARVLRPGGRLAIIDNTLFSLAGVLWSSILAFAEQPEALAHVMRVRFLPASWLLAMAMRMYGLAVLAACDGSRTFYATDGKAAIDRLRSTGAAAGFEFAADHAHREAVFTRFAQIIEERYAIDRGVPITHRYLAVIGEKP